MRNDPGGLLVQTLTWTELRLIPPPALAGGSFAFRVIGNLGRSVANQASPDLVNWSSLATNAYGPGNDGFTNSMADNTRRYYRAVTPPK